VPQLIPALRQGKEKMLFYRSLQNTPPASAERARSKTSARLQMTQCVVFGKTAESKRRFVRPHGAHGTERDAENGMNG
jgi:hypothetical protein